MSWKLDTRHSCCWRDGKWLSQAEWTYRNLHLAALIRLPPRSSGIETQGFNFAIIDVIANFLRSYAEQNPLQPPTCGSKRLVCYLQMLLGLYRAARKVVIVFFLLFRPGHQVELNKIAAGKEPCIRRSGVGACGTVFFSGLQCNAACINKWRFLFLMSSCFFA